MVLVWHVIICYCIYSAQCDGRHRIIEATNQTCMYLYIVIQNLDLGECYGLGRALIRLWKCTSNSMYRLLDNLSISRRELQYFLLLLTYPPQNLTR